MREANLRGALRCRNAGHQRRSLLNSMPAIPRRTGSQGASALKLCPRSLPCSLIHCSLCNRLSVSCFIWGSQMRCETLMNQRPFKSLLAGVALRNCLVRINKNVTRCIMGSQAKSRVDGGDTAFTLESLGCLNETAERKETAL